MQTLSSHVPTTRAYYAVVDFEATCWEDPTRRGDNEIIQIGCVRVRRSDGTFMGEFSTLVRPMRYPQLSALCRRITGLTQAAVDRAPSFPVAYDTLLQWLGNPHDHVLTSWGGYDRYLLRSACAFHRLPFHFADDYVNIKPAFSERFVGREVSLERALSIVGAPQPTVRHDALVDARNAAMLLCELLGRGSASNHIAPPNDQQ